MFSNLFHIMMHELYSSEEKLKLMNTISTNFIQNINHDIRNPLNVIIGFSEIIAEGNCTNNEKIEFMNIIRRNNDELLNTINKLFDYFLVIFNENELTYEEIDLNSFFMDIKKSCKNDAKGVDRVIFNNENIDSHCYTDKRKLNFIFHHLISNRLKESPKSILKLEYEINAENNMICFYLSSPSTSESNGDLFTDSDKKCLKDIHALENELDFFISDMITKLLDGKIEIKMDNHHKFIYIISLHIKTK